MTVHLDTTQPPPHPPTLAEAHALIDLLWQVIGQLQTRVAELEEQLRLTSRIRPSHPPATARPSSGRVALRREVVVGVAGNQDIGACSAP